MIKKILIIRFSSIGDIVLTTPVIRCLKKQLGAEIHFATKGQYVSLMQSNPFIDKIHVLQNSLPDFIEQVEKENFDFVVDLHNNLRTFIIKSHLQLSAKSFSKINFQKWLMVNFKVDILPRKHLVDRYLKTVHHLGVINDGEGLDYFIPEADIVDITLFPFHFQNGFTAIAIGGAHNTKKLPLERLIELCLKINVPIILLGGKEDFGSGEIVEKSDPNKIYNGCGKYSINQSASIIQQAQKVYTHDTSMMQAGKQEKLLMYSNQAKALNFI